MTGCTTFHCIALGSGRYTNPCTRTLLKIRRSVTIQFRRGRAPKCRSASSATIYVTEKKSQGSTVTDDSVTDLLPPKHRGICATFSQSSRATAQPGIRPNKVRHFFSVATFDTWQQCFRQLLTPSTDVIILYVASHCRFVYDVISPVTFIFFIAAPRNERAAGGLSTMFHVGSYP